MTNPAPPAAPSFDALNLLQATELAYQLAAAGQLSIVDLFNVAARLNEKGHTDISTQLYRNWLLCTVSPVAYAAQFNLGVQLANAGDDASAEAAYRAALLQKPDFLEGLLNLGTLLERNKRQAEALECWRVVLTVANKKQASDKIHYISALNNLGRLLEIQKHLAEAESMLQKSLKEDPKQMNVMTHWVHLRQKQCKWPVYDPKSGFKVADMIRGTSALAMLSASNDPELQLTTARNYVEEKVLKDVRYLAKREAYGHQRLRIGYLSSDFCSHAVSILTAEVYGLHDRAKFEVFGFCWSHEDGSPMRQRVINGMDHHIRIGGMSDEQAAQLIRSHEIDILVDLHGLTLGTRHNILSYRPAPLQITWLGFPGPTGLTEIDYVVSDPFVLPPELEPYFTEKPLHMPVTFQVNDRQRTVGPKPTRAACGLPEDKFVFCAFNNNFKITPEMFGAWMRILKRVPESVLWLVGDNEWVRENLQRQAEKAGIKSDRIYYAGRAVPSEYLARFQVADLCLDTFPFGGGTSASDALWAGLPLLSLCGKVFASRMAGSLLNAVELPELITYELKDYENKAVELANAPERIAAMKTHLVENRMRFPLFDSPRFMRAYEERLSALVASLPQPVSPARRAADLAYLTPPGTVGQRRYVLVAPPYAHNSAGIRVMYQLQQWLVRAGLDAIVCTWFQGYPVEQFADDIVIYPEVAPGNILGAKRVVRFILNEPGKLGHGLKTYDPSEVLVAYNKEMARYAGGMMLQVPSVEPFFHPDPELPKTADAFYVGKGQNLGVHPQACVEITKTYPASRRDVAQFLRTVRTLYMYDDFSMLGYEARLCGCEVKLINKDGQTVDYPHYDYPSLDEFKVQLHDFIEMTKRL